jgi:hypothetical protein
MATEGREKLRRALLAALGLMLVFLPVALGLLFFSDADLPWLIGIAGGAVAAFLIGRLLINWIFLK